LVIVKSKTQFWTKVKVFVGANLPEHFPVIYVKEEGKKIQKKKPKRKGFWIFS
jgi:tRNA pseudouridine-54 N-methylase